MTSFGLTVVASLLLASVIVGLGCKFNGPPAEPEHKANRGAIVQYTVEPDMPVLDLDYDDSWVGSVPEVIAGYRVISIDTPKNRACTREPLLTLHAPPGFVAGTLEEIFATVESVPAMPSNIIVSMSYSGMEPEQMADSQRRLRAWNETRLRLGCPEKSFGTLVTLPD